tara:strand:- start:144 stop:419 length:276 start_codon:yes stop_codon:yes gene_type:complete
MLDDSQKDIHDIKIPLSTRVLLYILTTPLKHVLKCLITEKLKFYQEVISQGNQKVDKDFDIKNVILKNRNLRHKLEVIKDRMRLVNDPDFK